MMHWYIADTIAYRIYRLITVLSEDKYHRSPHSYVE